ncbi:hypothetical protein C4D60_Mb06t05100 [Musa balbisiana]|uniref:Uncharacterized protein n=1 Tax=Musa balbisiana TaxID=52838 RepID=A0A4S8IN63_MUSBA|nr:hypothetical protein C4D60_Mb06t05100 [Musa balbisiana]
MDRTILLLIEAPMVADTEEYIDGLFTGNFGEPSPREPYHHPARRKRQAMAFVTSPIVTLASVLAAYEGCFSASSDSAGKAVDASASFSSFALPVGPCAAALAFGAATCGAVTGF